MIRRLIECLKTWEWELYKRRKRLRLKNERPVIIASNCVGAIAYKDLKLPFYSPTINLFINMDDFIRFVENLEWYLKQPILPAYEEGISFPVGMVGDIKIYFMHYDSFEDAVRAWERRIQRVDLNNLFIIGCERERCVYETLKQFDRLPYKNKVVFTQKDYPEFSSAFHIRGFEDKEELSNVLEFRKDCFWKRRYMDSFDYVSFFDRPREPLISVIVPVYQSEPYIETCVQSVLGQTYSNFELILVDDGSKDGGRQICESLGAREQRIRVLTQKHRGVSAARNTGIRAAKGEYLFFMDSDDAIHPGLLEQLCKLSEESRAAVSVCGYYSMLSQGFDEGRKRFDRRNYRRGIRGASYLKNQEALEAFIFEKGAESWSVIWGKLIRRVEAEGLWFDEELSYGEDTKYMYRLLERGADAAVLRYRGYYYRKRNGSASRRQSRKAYESIYRCDCYIRDREKEYGRETYAVQRERDLVSKISLWHAAGHMTCNENLKNYIWELEKAERASGLWGQLGFCTRLQHMLAFRCYPVYEICRILREIWRGIIGL